MSSSTSTDPVKLSAFTVQAWKRQVNTKSLDFAAWGILHDTEPRPDTSADAKTISSWNERRSKLLGYIMSTVDDTMADLFLREIASVDVHDLYLGLINTFEPKTAASRTTVLQELIAIRFGSAGHENESYQEYGNRAIALASRLSSLLPPGSTYVQENIDKVIVPRLAAASKNKGTYTIVEEVPLMQIKYYADHFSPSVYTPGYQATMLARELANSIIPIGLPASADALRRTLNLLDIASNPNAVMEALIAEDALARNTALHGGTSAAALATNDKKDKRPLRFMCDHHKANPTHDTKDCHYLNCLKKDAAKAASTPSTTTLTPSETAMMASVAHIKSPAVRRSHRTHSRRTTDTSWNPDSGATKHMTPHLKWLRNVVNVRIAVALANDQVVWATKMGQVWFQPVVNGRTGRTVIFNNVLYVPELQNNLFSVLSVVKNSKMRVVIEGEQMRFYTKDRELILTASIHGTTGKLDGTTMDNSTEEAFLSKFVSRDLLHQRLGHIGRDRLNTLLKQNLATGIVIEPGSTMIDICDDCLAGKQHRDPFPCAASHRSKELLGRIVSDVHGPLHMRTPGGFEYWITFVDDYSRYKEVRLLKKKSDAFGEFKSFVARYERKHGKPVKELRDDKGGEYISNEFNAWCDEKGITRQHTVRATPQQNGIAERLNRTLAEGVVAMLNQAKLPPSFWGAAVLYLTHILNATPSSSVSDTTSYAVWNGEKPDLSMYRVFGCRVHVNVLRKDRKNLDPHSVPCIFIGFSDGYKGWKVYNPATKTVSVAQDVVFNETEFPGLSTKGSVQVPPPALSIRSFWPDDSLAKDDTPAGGDPPDDDQDDDNVQDDPFPGDHDDDGSDDDDEGGAPRPATPVQERRDPRVSTPHRSPRPFNPGSKPPPSPTPRAKTPESDSDDDQNIDAPQFGRPPPPQSLIPVAAARLPVQPAPEPLPVATTHPPAQPAPTPVAARPPARPPAQPKPAPLPSQSTRPVRKAASKVLDYQTLDGSKRRGTAPAPRRQAVDEGVPMEGVMIPQRIEGVTRNSTIRRLSHKITLPTTMTTSQSTPRAP